MCLSVATAFILAQKSDMFELEPIDCYRLISDLVKVDILKFKS